MLLCIQTLHSFASTGNWISYIGNNPISQSLSIWNEIQYRDFTLAGDMSSLVLRTGINYSLSNQSQILMGYGYILNDPQDNQIGNAYYEHRIFQQGIHRHSISEIGLQHRVRLEERFIEARDMTLRFRYFIGATLPINASTMENGTLYASVFNELFLNFEDGAFDRDRIYGALGYQWSPYIRTELGYMSQIQSNVTQNQLQIAIFTNNPWF
jgi:hypothetical protein